METPFTHAAFKPDAAFTGAAERFFELLRSFGMPGTAAAGAGRDWSSLAGPLAGQFEQWLKTSQSAGPWFAAANAAASGPGAGVGAAQAGFFGPLPLGAGAAPQQDAQRTWDLVARLAQLQGQLAELAEAARSRGAGAPRPTRPAGTGRRKRPRKARA